MIFMHRGWSRHIRVVGDADGEDDGDVLGVEGLTLGTNVGFSLGLSLGTPLGEVEGAALEMAVGGVGLLVGAIVGPPHV